MAGFGFGPNEPDENDPKNNQPDGNPFAFGNFGEIFQQFSGMGLNLQGLMASLSGQSSPSTLSRQMIRDISRKFLSAHGEVPVSLQDLAALREAFDIADLWINEATTFPNLAIPENCAVSRRDWIDSTLTGWEELTTPLVDGMSQAMSEMLKESLGGDDQATGIEIPGLGAMNIPQSSIAAIMSTFMSSLISTQLGQTIGNLSTTVTGANDVALPLTNPIRPQLIPQYI